MKIVKKTKAILRAFGVIDGVKISLLHTLNKKKIYLKMKNNVRIWLKEINEFIYIRPYTSDIVLILGMFYRLNTEEKNEYEIDWKNKVITPQNIIDAGANIGIFSLMYTKKYPDAKIIAFEPEETNFEMLLKNTKRFKNIICIKAGLWNKDAYLQVIPRDTGNWGFYVEEINDQAQHIGGVKGVCLDTVIEEYDMDYIDILKMDIEGSELEIFSDNTAWLDKTKGLIIETHERFRPGSDGVVMKILTNKNYKMEINGENKVFWI